MNEASSHGDLPLADAERIAYLIAGFLGNSLTEAEHDELDAWIVASDENTRLFEELTDQENIEAGLHWHQNLQQQKALKNIKQRINPNKKSLLTTFALYAVAACLFLAVVGYFFFQPRVTNPKNQVDLSVAPAAVQPGTDRAVLILEDGRTLLLDTSGSGNLVQEKGITVTQNGKDQLAYRGRATERISHTLSTPKGGQYSITLSDGTRVWLNAESSLQFPVSFPDGQRVVLLRGEGYFEVAKQGGSPFRVKTVTRNGDSTEVEVMGTHFNINSYGDEAGSITTLVEGAVRLRYRSKTVVLKPGEQGQITTGIRVSQANMEAVLGWKNGRFVFRDASMQHIGSQIARWYNVDIEYNGAIPYHFNATIERKEPLSRLLQLLQQTKRVRFTLEGKKLIIQP